MNIVYNGEMDSRAFKDILGKEIPALAAQDPDVIYLDADLMRSEERRVGKECRSRWSPYH